MVLVMVQPQPVSKSWVATVLEWCVIGVCVLCHLMIFPKVLCVFMHFGTWPPSYECERKAVTGIVCYLFRAAMLLPHTSDLCFLTQSVWRGDKYAWHVSMFWQTEEAEAQTRSAQAAAAKNCEQRISEVLTTTRLRAAVIEEEHKAQLSECNSTISKLRVCSDGLSVLGSGFNSYFWEFWWVGVNTLPFMFSHSPCVLFSLIWSSLKSSCWLVSYS